MQKRPVSFDPVPDRVAALVVRDATALLHGPGAVGAGCFFGSGRPLGWPGLSCRSRPWLCDSRAVYPLELSYRAFQRRCAGTDVLSDSARPLTLVDAGLWTAAALEAVERLSRVALHELAGDAVRHLRHRQLCRHRAPTRMSVPSPCPASASSRDRSRASSARRTCAVSFPEQVAARQGLRVLEHDAGEERRDCSARRAIVPGCAKV